MKNLPPGSRLGRFELLGILGEGAMGIVYLANDPEIERRVAIKTLRSTGGRSASEGELEARFLKEAKLAGRLQHPNIVTIYEVGREEEAAFIAMEYVEGLPLYRFNAPGSALTLSERIEIVRQVAQALQHAHERGVLHRDIKPGNILVTPDRRVKVADFGIGKLLSGGSADLTRTGQMLGSPAYMSPEQIRGEKLDGRSDLFSLGVVFYELLTGSRPFPGESITTLVYQILHTEPRDPLELRSDLPAAARQVLARLLAKAPDRRPADAGEFLREIRKIEGELEEVEATQVMAASVARPKPAGPLPEPPAPVLAPAGPPAIATVPYTPPPPPPATLTTGGVSRGAGPLYLFGLAALLVAAAILIWIWRTTGGGEEKLASVTTPAPARAEAPASGGLPLPTSAPTEAPTPIPLPTSGPAAAADAIVGATRLVNPTAAPARRPSPSAPEETAAREPTSVHARIAAAEAPAGASSFSASLPPADNIYRTRHYVKFGSSPDQARVYVDGRYVGIVDDWDDHGGGKTLPFAGRGVHRVRLELPGYRALNLDVILTPSAEDETVDVEDELKRESRVPYPKLPSPADRTVGPVEFRVDPPDAVVSEGGRTLGPASSFGAASPLRLPGPMVHDLVLSAPGRQPKTVRILVSSNADREKAVVKEKLKER